VTSCAQSEYSSYGSAGLGLWLGWGRVSVSGEAGGAMGKVSGEAGGAMGRVGWGSAGHRVGWGGVHTV
jgi:hypothetical protein